MTKKKPLLSFKDLDKAKIRGRTQFAVFLDDACSWSEEPVPVTYEGKEVGTIVVGPDGKGEGVITDEELADKLLNPPPPPMSFKASDYKA